MSPTSVIKRKGSIKNHQIAIKRVTKTKYGMIFVLSDKQ